MNKNEIMYKKKNKEEFLVIFLLDDITIFVYIGSLNFM